MTTAEEKIREFLGHPCDVGSDCTEPECVIARGLLAALTPDDGSFCFALGRTTDDPLGHAAVVRAFMEYQQKAILKAMGLDDA